MTDLADEYRDSRERLASVIASLRDAKAVEVAALPVQEAAAALSRRRAQYDCSAV